MNDASPLEIRGKAAAVTGGAVGIGFGIAKRFVEAGADVLIVDREESAAREVLMFTKSFALEMARHRVNVNMIAPGGIETEGTSQPLAGSGMTAEEMAAFKRTFVETKVPFRRMGLPDDIAKVALFLASPATT